MLPPELEKPAPRDVSQVERLIAKNRGLTKNLYIWSFAFVPLMMLISWWKFGEDSVWTFGLFGGLGITALCMLWGFAMDMNTKRAIRLFQHGKATTGTVVKLQAPADRKGSAYVLTYIEYKTANGNTWKGHAMNSAHVSEIDHKVGDEVAVLYLEDQPGKFGIYTSGIGMSTGAAKRIN